MIFPGFPGVLSFFQVFQIFQVEWEPWICIRTRTINEHSKLQWYHINGHCLYLMNLPIRYNEISLQRTTNDDRFVIKAPANPTVLMS